MDEMKKLLAEVQGMYDIQLKENNAIKEVIKHIEQKYHAANDEKERFLDELIKLKSEQGEGLNQMNQLQKEVSDGKLKIEAQRKMLEEERLAFEKMKSELDYKTNSALDTGF